MTNTQHQKRIKHFDFVGHAHYFTFSCYHRLPMLSKDRTRLWLVGSLRKTVLQHSLDVWAWVIMPEHVHLLVYPRNLRYDASKILASIKKPVGYKAIQFLKETNPLFLERLTVINRNRTYHHFWQVGPGYDENINDVHAVHNVVDYIHANPVRRGLVTEPTEWQWSSARDYAGLESPHLQVDRTIPMLHS